MNVFWQSQESANLRQTLLRKQNLSQAGRQLTVQPGDHAGYVDPKTTLRDNVPRSASTARGIGKGTRTAIHCLKTKIKFKIFKS